MSRMYLHLLRLYPRRFRDEYGPAMLQLFRDRVREEGYCRVWRDVVSELLTSLPREHWRAHARELSIAGATLAVVAFGFWMAFPRGPQPAHLPLADVPSVVGEWTQHYDSPVTETTFETLGTRDVLKRVYTGKRRHAELFVARWRSNHFFTSRRESEMDGWRIEQEDTKEIPVAGSTPLRATQVMLEKGQDSALVLWWYHRTQTTSRDVLWGNLLRKFGIEVRWGDSAIVRVILTGDRTDPGYQTAAESFIQAIYPELSKRL
jgi:Protein of unknown function (DUF3485)